MDIHANAVQLTAKPKEKEKKKGKRRGKLLRRIVILLLLGALLAAVGYVGYSRLKQEYTVTYQPYSATVGTISNSLSFSGTLQAIDSATYTASSATTVRSIYVNKGGDVKDGDRLMRLANGTIIEAEFDGRVNQLPVAEGDEVASGDTLIQVVDFSRMQVSLRVDEYDISDVKVGDAVKVTTTATENTFDTTIDDINYVSSSSGSVAYYTATAYVDVADGVYPGMQVTVTVPQEEASNVVILKEEALGFDAANQAFVYTQGENGEMEQTYVKIGVSNGKYVQITDGLKDGDTVYAVVEAEETSAVGGLLSSLFGGQQMMGGGPQGRPDFPTDGMPDFEGGEMPFMPGGNGGSGGSGSMNGGGRP